MLGRRFIILVAVLMGLTALAASLAPRQPVSRDQRGTEPTPAPTVVADGSVKPVPKTISTRRNNQRVTVHRGDLLELTVKRGDELDSVELLDEVVPISPEADAVFNIYADTVGEYPIELVDAGERIGTLVIRP
jgi:hypothetical protein